MRRAAPIALLALILALLVSYIAYTRSVVIRLRQDAGRLSQMYARVYDALADTTADDGSTVLFDLAGHIDSLGVPVILTDASGRPTAAVNLPFSAGPSDARVAEYVRELDRENDPVPQVGGGYVHYGDSRLVRSLRFIPAVQAVLLALVLGAGIFLVRLRGRAERERVWAGMARESAHQLATPLTSLSGWIELLTEEAEEGRSATAVRHMRGDLDRLERVAHRFERIGRPPRREAVDICALAAHVAGYFQARVPTLAHRVTVASACGEQALPVQGDPVLLEWALEALAKNAVDALAGRGGRLDISAERVDESRVRVRVADDGPGVPRELRSRIFAAGFSTKQSGWGIGLSLAKRIVEDNHGGRLVLVPTDRGATFDVILRG
ncbi:MAG: HAMP domain-containing sensor histidine kinase [Gemmatimonadaceae bacterium]